MTNLLEELTQIDGVSGCEQAVCERIRREIEPHCEKVYEDNMGNLIALKRGKNIGRNKVMVCAHMDEVGFIIKGIDDGGTLRFETVGGIDPRVLPAKRVKVGDRGIFGVIGAMAVHLYEKEERDKAIKIDNMYIDIGASSKEEASKMVGIGDYVSFDSGFTAFGDGLISAKALDDRAGCAVLCEIIKEDLPYDTYFLFTVGEEVGHFGASAATFSLKPDIAIIAECTTAADFLKDDLSAWVTKLGDGVALSLMDKASIYHKGLIDTAIKAADAKGIKWQYKKSIAGGNDAGIIHKSSGGVRVMTLSIPCRNLHAPHCVINTFDYRSMKNLIGEILQSVGGKEFEQAFKGSIDG